MRARPDISSRRAAALLLVLAALVLVMTASVSIARVAATAKQRTAFQLHRAFADDLRRASDAAILHWLEAHSTTVVLPPDAKTPSIEILHDQCVDTERSFRIQITAFDQCGMVPAELLNSGSPIRLAMPQDVVTSIDGIDLPKESMLGLDLFKGRADLGKLAIFPTSPHSASRVFGDGEGVGQSDSPEFTSAEPDPTIGSFIATHNPAPGMLNVNTTPVDVLEAAMRAAGMGGIDQIIAARSNGKPAPAPGHNGIRGRDRNDRVQFIASSNVWAFRIDIHVGPLQRSWWSIYAQGFKGWECVQRLAIPE